MKEQILIIWAGPAGLTLWFELLSRASDKYEVIIIEKDIIVWGLAQTYNHKGNRIDIGGHRFFSKNKRVMDRWFSQMPLQGVWASDYKLLGIECEVNPGGPDPDKEDLVMLARRRLSRIFWDRKFFDYPLSITRDTLSKFWFVDLFLCWCSYIIAKFRKYDMSNLEGFYKSRFGTRLYHRFFDAYTFKVWGKPASQISSARWAQRVKGLNLAKAVRDYFKKIIIWDKQSTNTETSLIGKFYYPKLGPGQMREVVSEKIKELGGTILLETDFLESQISNKEGKNTIHTVSYNEKGVIKTLTPDLIVSTAPIKYLLNTMKGADTAIQSLGDKLEYRDFITVGILANKLLVSNTSNYKTIGNIIPDNRIYIHDVGTIVGRIQIFNNWSPYMVADSKNIWIGLEYFCSKGDEIWNKSDEELIQLGVEELIKMELLDKKDLLDGVVRRMENTYPCYFGEGYEKFDSLKDYLDGVSNLFCIGRNGAHRYNNQDHSMLSAMRLADMLIENNIYRSELWNINMEEEYQEELSDKSDK
jgi:protoporphyrinogen oxidase